MLAAALASLGAAAPPPGPAIPIEMANGRFIVPVLLDGGLAHILLDTGAERSVISRTAAARLGLPFDPWVETTMRGAGGQLETHRNADVQIATLGGVRLLQRPAQAVALANYPHLGRAAAFHARSGLSRRPDGAAPRPLGPAGG